MKHRNIAPEVISALQDTPVVLINGARQTGKTTLVKSLAAALTDDPGVTGYVTLDDASQLAAAEADPEGFIAFLSATQSSAPVIIDEVQRLPTLLRAIKKSVDEDRRPGRFLLTGSANVLMLPNVSESLAGRMQIVTLWPFSQGEIDGKIESFVDDIFSADVDILRGQRPNDPSDDIEQRVIRGGYPEVVSRKDHARRRAWFESYLTTILQRDVRDIADIEGLTQLPRLLSLIATRLMTVSNYSELSRSIGLPNTTLKRYLTLLEATFLLQLLQPWHVNAGKRLVKSPKMLLTDSGLAAYLTGYNPNEGPRTRNTAFGPLLENFVAMELRKQITWSNLKPSLYFFRTHSGSEVDLVIESPSGDIVTVEVKSAASVSASDFRGAKLIREMVPDQFRRGIVLYRGTDVVRFADDLFGVPVRRVYSLRSRMKE